MCVGVRVVAGCGGGGGGGGRGGAVVAAAAAAAVCCALGWCAPVPSCPPVHLSVATGRMSRVFSDTDRQKETPRHAGKQTKASMHSGAQTPGHPGHPPRQ